MEITVYEDYLATDGTFIIDKYIDYFKNNLQEKIEIDGTIYLKGASSAYAFMDNLTDTPEFERWAKDDTLDALHKRITANGMKLCPLNFFTLCQYVLSLIKEQYLGLLKPTISDTLTELKDVQSIAFTNADGTVVNTSNTNFIKMLLDNVKADIDAKYEVEKIVRIDNITDKVIIQSSFTYYIALFLKEYFKDYPRRSNCCMVSAIEQKLILYMLYFFGLAPAPLTDSRFRQLIGFFKDHRTSINYSNFPEIGFVPISFIKYADWKDGNINLGKLQPLNVGDNIFIPHNVTID